MVGNVRDCRRSLRPTCRAAPLIEQLPDGPLVDAGVGDDVALEEELQQKPGLSQGAWALRQAWHMWMKKKA